MIGTELATGNTQTEYDDTSEEAQSCEGDLSYPLCRKTSKHWGPEVDMDIVQCWVFNAMSESPQTAGPNAVSSLPGLNAGAINVFKNRGHCRLLGYGIMWLLGSRPQGLQRILVLQPNKSPTVSPITITHSQGFLIRCSMHSIGREVRLERNLSRVIPETFWTPSKKMVKRSNINTD